MVKYNFGYFDQGAVNYATHHYYYNLMLADPTQFNKSLMSGVTIHEVYEKPKTNDTQIVFSRKNFENMLRQHQSSNGTVQVFVNLNKLKFNNNRNNFTNTLNSFKNNKPMLVVVHDPSNHLLHIWGYRHVKRASFDRNMMYNASIELY